MTEPAGAVAETAAIEPAGFVTDVTEAAGWTIVQGLVPCIAVTEPNTDVCHVPA